MNKLKYTLHQPVAQLSPPQPGAQVQVYAEVQFPPLKHPCGH